MLIYLKRKIKYLFIKTKRALFRLSHPGWDKVTLPENPKISFCTACMGRLHHLKETLLRNIEDNKDYPNVEFVILNYNSPDEMEDWAKQNLGELIASGKVTYYRTDQPKYFHMSHAKNVVHKLASGDIVCNLDADNFTGKGFAEFLNGLFRINHRISAHGDWKIRRGSNGRIAVLKKFFMLTRGYDESFQGWGAEDLDFIARLANLGVRPLLIDNAGFLNTIEHDKIESVKHMAPEYFDYKVTVKKGKQTLRATKQFLKLSANQGSPWGKCKVFKNFGEKVIEV